MLIFIVYVNFFLIGILVNDVKEVFYDIGVIGNVYFGFYGLWVFVGYIGFE